MRLSQKVRPGSLRFSKSDFGVTLSPLELSTFTITSEHDSSGIFWTASKKHEKTLTITVLTVSLIHLGQVSKPSLIDFTNSFLINTIYKITPISD